MHKLYDFSFFSSFNWNNAAPKPNLDTPAFVVKVGYGHLLWSSNDRQQRLSLIIAFVIFITRI